MIIYLQIISLIVMCFAQESQMNVPEGFNSSVLASKPLIQDPVAFWIQPDGQLLIAETERTNHGTMDNRTSTFWLKDDLQAETVEDRMAYYRKWRNMRKTGMDFYTERPDRLRSSRDTDGDGLYDESTILAGPFNDHLDGIGAGVITVDDEVWYTNIPNLWRLVDEDGDGIAEVKEVIHTGFGVRTALYGHDMHGLVRGPDGRVYWSIGDRGYHVQGADGEFLSDPRSGAVFRCEADGSGLELFHTGLRNPQELAFNSVGDLFSGDNTSDAGDKARIVFVAEDGQTGWSMEYQTMEGSNQRGPWNQEAIWEVETDENRDLRPAWSLPPIAHVGSGPSGFTYYPGVGFGPEFDDHFLMCDFRGSRKGSGVWAFSVEPSGASYVVKDPEMIISNVLCTDVMFDWQGRILISEWGSGWSSSQSGYLHAAWDPSYQSDPRIAEGRDMAINGMEGKDAFDLSDLLSYPDMRIRQKAQFELAKRGDAVPLKDVLLYSDNSIARLHAIWGIGQIIRSRTSLGRSTKTLQEILIEGLTDGDSEVRAQAAKTLGDPPCPQAEDACIALLSDESLRVRYHAAMTLGKLKSIEAIPFIVGMIMENSTEDLLLRHAAATALWKIGDTNALAELAAHPLPSVRMCAVLAMRRLHHPSLKIAMFDDDDAVSLAAVRAVHDLPVPDAMPALASLSKDYEGTLDSIDLNSRKALTHDDVRITPLLRRVISANQKIGDERGVSALAGIASNEMLPEHIRLEALDALRDFSDPAPRDRVLGWWRPVTNSPREEGMISKALQAPIQMLSADGNESVRQKSIELAGAYSVKIDPEQLFEIVMDTERPVEDRILCLKQLPSDNPQRIRETLDVVLTSSIPALRSAARSRLLLIDPDAGFKSVQASLQSTDVSEQQASILSLVSIRTPEAQAEIHGLSNQLLAGTLHPAIALDTIEAAQSLEQSDGIDPSVRNWWSTDQDNNLEAWDVTTTGGNAAIGSRIVRFHSGATCLRCHVIDGSGGNAGPALDGVGKRLDKNDLMRSIINPQETIVEGYGDGGAMPNMRDVLTPREIRDVVAYLSTLTSEAEATGH